MELSLGRLKVIGSITSGNNYYYLERDSDLLFTLRMEIPKLRQAVLTGRLLIAVEPEIEKDLKDLKHNHDVDTSEWLRRLIRSELPKLKAQILA